MGLLTFILVSCENKKKFFYKKSISTLHNGFTINNLTQY